MKAPAAVATDFDLALQDLLVKFRRLAKNTSCSRAS